MCAGSSTRLCRTLRCPEGLMVRRWDSAPSRLGRPGSTGRCRQQKDTSPLRRGALLVILNASSRSFDLRSLAGCSVFHFSTVGPCLAGQRKLSGFTYTTIVMFCLSSVLAPAQGGVESRLRRCRGVRILGLDQWAGASRRVGGERLGDGTAPGRCSVAESSSGELRGRSEVLGLDLRVGSLGWSANV